jgi:hypothetical protein
MRQYTFGALMIASAPDDKVFEAGIASREEFADRAAASSGSPPRRSTTDCAPTTCRFQRCCGSSRRWRLRSAWRSIVFLLYRREFHSEVLAILRN